jgi:hypothetical protein
MLRELLVTMAGASLVHGAFAQDETNIWLRYALRIPVNHRWTVQAEPDFRTQLSPESGAFRMWLWRVDAQRKLNDAHMVAAGFVGVRTGYDHKPTLVEWRPQLSWMYRPGIGRRDLLLRARAEWREQQVLADASPAIRQSTLRCRLLVQRDLPIRRDNAAMRMGFRAQAELFTRAYTTADLGFYDQLRLSMGWVMPMAERVEIELTDMWMFGDSGETQQWIRLIVSHRLAPRKDRSTTSTP